MRNLRNAGHRRGPNGDPIVSILKTMADRIGKSAVYTEPRPHELLDGDTAMSFAVTVTDAKRVYGVTKYRIRPVAGAGERWVNESSLSFPSGDDGRPRPGLTHSE